MEREHSHVEEGINRAWLNGMLMLSVAVLVLLSSVTTVDRAAAEDHEALFQRALVTFALARTLNGLISAVQGTELALQPAGVGVTLTPGEVLDPVNDMIERFSWIMLGATLSLGVQQVLLDVGQWWGVRLLLGLLGVFWLWARLRGGSGSRLASTKTTTVLLRAFVVVLFIRFAVPLALLVNEALYTTFLETRYTESTQVIGTAGADLQKATSQDPATSQSESESGLFDSLGQALEGTREAMNFKERLAEISERAGEVVENLIQLSVVFILQTGILPIAFLWIFLQVLKQLFRQIKV
jgi:hypothetical protein